MRHHSFGKALFAMMLAAWLTAPHSADAQTRAEGRSYFLRLEANLPPDQAAKWKAAPGYGQMRDNFLSADQRPTLSASMSRKLSKTARRAARKDTRCRMDETGRNFGTALSLDRQIERQILTAQLRNSWSYHIQLAGCDGTYQANFVIIEQTDGDLDHITTLPGSTLTWPSLQQDALPKIALTALQTVRQQDPTCIPSGRDRVIATQVMDTRLPKREKMFGVIMQGSWMEKWTMTICRQKLDLQLAFRADGRGGANFQAQSRQTPIAKRSDP